MKYKKNLIILFFILYSSVGGAANSLNQHKVDSLKKILFFKNDDLTAKIEGKILSDISNYYLQIGDVKNAKLYNWKSLQIFYDLKNYRNVTKILLDLGINEIKSNQYDKAIRFHFAALEVLEVAKANLSDKEYKFYYGMILMNIGIVYEEIKNYNQALRYMHESHNNLVEADVDSLYMAVSYANIGMTYGGLEQYKLAKNYHEKAVNYYGEVGTEKYYKAIAYNNLGDAYLSEGNHKTALEYYNKSLAFYKNQDKFISNYSAVLTSIADVYLQLEEIENADIYLQLALETANKDGGDRFIEYVYESMVKYYTQTNNSKKAFENLKILNEIKDSLYHPEILAKIAHYQKKYDFKKIEKKNQLEFQLLEQNQLLRLYKWYVFSGVCVVLFLITLLLFYKQRHKGKFNKIALQNTKLEKEQLNSQLKFKNGQLTNYAMYILKKNEFLEVIKRDIDNIKNNTTDTKAISLLSSIVNQHLTSARDRKDFEIRIEKENQDFYYKLQNNFPDLTDKDKKLCSLLLLDLSSKEMSALMNITVGSVEKSRYRLRKKLDINSEINLSNFLNNL